MAIRNPSPSLALGLALELDVTLDLTRCQPSPSGGFYRLRFLSMYTVGRLCSNRRPIRRRGHRPGIAIGSDQ